MERLKGMIIQSSKCWNIYGITSFLPKHCPNLIFSYIFVAENTLQFHDCCILNMQYWYMCDIWCVHGSPPSLMVLLNDSVALTWRDMRCHDNSWVLSGRHGWRHLVSASVWGVVGERCLAWEDLQRYSLTKAHIIEIILACKSVLHNGKYIGCL